MKFKGVTLPLCTKCKKFIGNDDCVTAKNLEDNPDVEFFEDLEPYHFRCWNCRIF